RKGCSTPPNSKAKARPNGHSQRRIPDDFLVLLVECVFDIRVGCHPRTERVPSAQIHVGVAGRVVNSETEEVGVSAPANKTSPNIRSPAIAQVVQQQTARMFWPTD